jgi:hypothetical protein
VDALEGRQQQAEHQQASALQGGCWGRACRAVCWGPCREGWLLPGASLSAHSGMPCATLLVAVHHLVPRCTPTSSCQQQQS